MGWLFDTNILSELRRPRPEQKVINFIRGCRIKELHVSVATLAELRFGIDILSDSLRRAELSKWLDEDVRPMFAERVLEITEDIMLRWRFIVEERRKMRRMLSQPDLLIAATALEHDLTLVTRNVKDFSDLGLQIINPWQD